MGAGQVRERIAAFYGHLNVRLESVLYFQGVPGEEPFAHVGISMPSHSQADRIDIACTATGSIRGVDDLGCGFEAVLHIFWDDSLRIRIVAGGMHYVVDDR